jgi:hypothetical protein
VVLRTWFIAHAQESERHGNRLNQVGDMASTIGTAAPEAAEGRGKRE